MNVALSPELKTWVTHQVDTARFASASQYVRALILQDQRYSSEIEEIVALASNSICDVSGGEHISTDHLLRLAERECRERAWGRTIDIVLQRKIAELRTIGAVEAA